MKETVTEMLAGCFRTDQKCPYLRTSNKNKLLVKGKNVGLCLYINLKASFWGLFRTNFTSLFHKLFLFTKFIFLICEKKFP